MTRTRGRDLLRAVLTTQQISQVAIARKLQLSQNSVSLWTRGLSRPEHHHRLALQNLLTIPADSWLTRDERRIAGLPEMDPAPEMLADPKAA